MAFNKFVKTKPEDVHTFIATEALEAHRLVIITATDDAKVEYPAAQFDACFGITLHAAALGGEVAVATAGIALLKVDGQTPNITPDMSITCHGATGLGQGVVGGAAANREAIGKYLGAATITADGDLIPVQIGKHTVYFAS